MRCVLAAALAVALLQATGKGIPWHTARPSDSVAKRGALSETWDLRAVSPNGRRAIVVRFWTKDNPYYIEWLWYQHGRSATGYAARVEPAKHAGPGVSMKEPFGHGSIQRVGQRWLLDAYGSLTWRLRAHLVLRAVRPGITVGPLPASAGTARGVHLFDLLANRTDSVCGRVCAPTGRSRRRDEVSARCARMFLAGF
jgi:hypothetical protein